MNEIKTLNGYPLADETARTAAATNAEAIGQLTEEMGNYIPVPQTATVGQTIVVKTVDESGKPTEWEAVDAASGGYKTIEITMVDGVCTANITFEELAEAWDSRTLLSGTLFDYKETSTVFSRMRSISAYGDTFTMSFVDGIGTNTIITMSRDGSIRYETVTS